MPWSGGVFTPLWSWVVDAVSFPDMLPSRFDTYEDDQASGINNCLTKDGQNVPTANLPMAGFRHTGVGSALARTQYASAAQVQDGAFNYGTDTGVADAYVTALSPAITAYATGMVIWFSPANTNTGASTINVNSVGVKNIKIGASALTAGQLVAGQVYGLQYDGTDFQALNVLADSSVANITSGTINGAIIGGTTPVAGTFTNLTCNNFTELSDERFKSEIEPLGEVNGIMGLVPVTYLMDGKKRFGFVAQQVRDVYPHLVHDDGSRLSLDYIGLIAPLVKMVQNLKREVEELKNA